MYMTVIKQLTHMHAHIARFRNSQKLQEWYASIVFCYPEQLALPI